VAEATLKHQQVLAEVYEQVPESAKSAIAHALEVSSRGYQQALSQLSQQKRDRVTRRLQQQKQNIEKKIQKLKQENLKNFSPAAQPPLPPAQAPQRAVPIQKAPAFNP